MEEVQTDDIKEPASHFITAAVLILTLAVFCFPVSRKISAAEGGKNILRLV